MIVRFIETQKSNPTSICLQQNATGYRRMISVDRRHLWHDDRTATEHQLANWGRLSSAKIRRKHCHRTVVHSTGSVHLASELHQLTKLTQLFTFT